MIIAPSILITDDDLDFRDTLRTVFEMLGFHTLTAADGEEALSIVGRQQELHLVLLDMHMPKLTGLETLRRIKLMRSMVPCILLSAALDDDLIRQAEHAQAFSVLSKPVTRFDITSTVQDALRRTYNWPIA